MRFCEHTCDERCTKLPELLKNSSTAVPLLNLNSTPILLLTPSETRGTRESNVRFTVFNNFKV